MAGGTTMFGDPIIAPPAGGFSTSLSSPPEKPDKPHLSENWEMGPDGTARPIPGSAADPSRPVQIPGDTTKVGPDYLKTVPDNIRNRAQQLIEGRSILTAREKGTPAGQILMDVANQADPNFNEAVSQARYTERTQYTGMGKGSLVVQAAERLARHTNDLYAASNKMPGPNLGLAPLSNLATGIAQAFDQKDVAQYNTILPLIAGELQKLTKNGTATVDESKHIMDNLKAGQPRDVRNGAIQEIMRLGEAQFQPLRDSWNSAWQGANAPPMPMDFSPTTNAIMDAIAAGKDAVQVDRNGNIIGGSVGAPPVNSGTGGAPPPGAPPATSGGPTPPPLSPGDPAFQAAGATRRTAAPEIGSHIDAMVRQGASYADINEYAQSKGIPSVNPQEFMAVKAFLRKNPTYQGSLVDAWKIEPTSAYQQTVTKLGDNPVGAYAVGAGQMLTGNAIDNLTSDPAAARLNMDIATADSPNAAALGQVSGGVMASALGEAGLARMGMGAGLARSAIADAGMGAVNGAGSADAGNRLLGAAKGGVAAAAGGVAGNLGVKGLGRAFSPTGGPLADLYTAGVRPTIGQRFANVNGGKGFTGMVGKAVNATEEGLQSVPLVGSAIKGARQDARDQFQVGAFNQSLGEIGEKLPDHVGPGTDAHKFAQNAFNRVYSTARGSMRVVADQDLTHDLSGLAPDIATLGPQAQNKLKSILDNSVNNKLQNGVMDGTGYKQAVSDLGKHIARLGKSSIADDQQLAGVLEGVQAAIDSAARRHSSPDAVKLLDAADAGYAKFVRIEEASARRGGASGTFSPAGFDSAVQKTSGGVRSKAYLRGDALMQDYADAGRTLEDRIPNSGTPERMAIGGAVAGGLSYVSPATLGVLGAIGGAYAPGARKVVAGAMAPSGPTGRAISAQLKKIERLGGATTAAISASASQGTSPSP